MSLKPLRCPSNGWGHASDAPGWHDGDRLLAPAGARTPEQTVTVRGKTYVAEPGWDRVYVFGPRDFVQLLTTGDAARLFAHDLNRRAFRDLERPLYVPSGRVVPMRATG